MTVASTTNRKTYAGDDATTSFGTSPVVFFNTSDLVVQVVTDATGAATTLTENTHYTVSGGAGSTGTIDLSGGTSAHGALATGTTLVILRVVPLTQATDFVNNDLNDAEVLEDALDKLTMIDQQQQETLARAITLPSSESGTMTLPTLANRANAYLAFDASGDMIAAADPASYPASTFMGTVLDDTSAGAALTTLGVSAYAQTLLDDANAGAAQTTLGVSTYAKTLLDDTNAAVARATLGSGTAGDAIFTATLVPIGQNLLPNTNWQLMSNVGYTTAMNYQGTGTQPTVSCSSFETSNNQPTFLTSDTKQLYNGCLVTFPDGNDGLSGTALRVINLVANTSFTCQLQLGGLSPASSAAIVATPIGRGDIIGNTTGAVADGWSKDPPVVCWVDDFAVNACVGAKRVLGVRKASVNLEVGPYCTLPARDLAKYKGRTVTFGALVYQKVQAGNTWKLRISDGVTDTDSAAGTGAAYSDATYGGYEFISVTKTLSSSATELTVKLILSAGAVGDVFYFALPTLVFGSVLTRESCGPNPQEIIAASTHWNPPMLTPLAATFPAAAHADTGGLLYGYDSTACDISAMSYGAVHQTVKEVKAKIELTTATAGANFFTGSTLTPAKGGLTFGPQVLTQVSSVVNAGQGWWPLDTDGNGAIFVASSALVIANATFDFDDVLV